MTLTEILDQTQAAKERSSLLFSALEKQPGLEKEWHTLLSNAKPPVKAALLEAVECLTKENPERGKKFIDASIECLSDKAPAVLREAGRVVANVSAAFPEECSKAIPQLLENTSHEGTIVRWASAFALSQIALHHPPSAKKLVPLFKKMSETEVNNGVKNHYVKALKKLSAQIHD